MKQQESSLEGAPIYVTANSLLRNARHLHVTGIPPALSDTCRQYTYHAIEQAREAGMSISFDPNLRPVLWKSEEEMRQVLNDLATRADWVFPGLQEGIVLTGYTTPEEIANFYLEKGVKLVAVKVGARGSCLFTASDRYEVKKSLTKPANDRILHA